MLRQLVLRQLAGCLLHGNACAVLRQLAGCVLHGNARSGAEATRWLSVWQLRRYSRSLQSRFSKREFGRC